MKKQTNFMKIRSLIYPLAIRNAYLTTDAAHSRTSVSNAPEENLFPSVRFPVFLFLCTVVIVSALLNHADKPLGHCRVAV